MTYNNFTVETDADGIALITWDMTGRSMNVITEEVMDEIEKIIEDVAGAEAIKGAVVTSGKEAFSGGADLSMIEALLSGKGGAVGPEALLEGSSRMSKIYRRLETCGKPFVAAINGTAMGGAFELALACHGRVAADTEKAKLGLPEVKVGLLPGAGGTQRVARMVDLQSALQMLMQGQELRVAKAKSLGLVDQVVPAGELIDAAKAMLKAGVDPVKPWDKDKFRLPSGPVYSATGFQIFPAANAIYRRETADNYPAGRAIVSCVYEGLQLPMDLGLRVESRYFAHLLTTPVARNMIRSLFLSMQDLNKLARRPADVAPSSIKKVGILGAGFMGAGIAYVTAAAGIDVVLVDRDQEAAEKGKAHADKLISGRVSKGRAKPEQKEKLLSHIHPTADYNDLKGCDLIVEAVFEDRALKAKVTELAEAQLDESAVFGSNTSTLPITSLAT
ncbi:MAG: enoyl-CoA hydratase/isomerase family protein, partial [Hyphomicrobiales bacterium]|nr:enoyl-CoA hydratase/isomerase family protein [Hyphomicrobiales bacterium]